MPLFNHRFSYLLCIIFIATSIASVTALHTTGNAAAAIHKTTSVLAPQTKPSAVADAAAGYVNDFVVANGTQLRFRSSGQPYKFVGVTQFALINNANICGKNYNNRQVDTLLAQVHRMGANVIRFWAMMPLTKAGTYFARLDYLVRQAPKYNIRLIPVLENEWHVGNCGAGPQKDDNWYKYGYLTNYGGGTDYKTYVSRVVPRYKNNTAILMWQMMNEAEDRGDGIYSFAADMSTYIKSLDGNHMVNLGTMSASQYGVSIYHNPCDMTDGFVKIYSLPTMDIADGHDYNSPADPYPSHIRDDQNCSNNVLKKPFFIGEAGILSSDRARPVEFRNKMQTIFDNGGVGYTIWTFDSGPNYVFGPTDPLATKVIPAICAKYHIQ